MYIPSYQPPSFLKMQRSYLAIEDVETTLKSKKIVLLKPKDYQCSFDNKWKTLTLSVLWFSIIVAVTGFMLASLYGAHIDHLQDRVTVYQINKEQYQRHFGRYLPTDDDMWVDHTKDSYVPNLNLGLQIFVPLATLPPVIVLIIWKVIHTYRNSPLLQKQKRLDDFILDLQCTKRSSPKTKLKKNSLSELIALDSFSDEDASILSFSQIKWIKKTDHPLFTSLLNKNKLSDVQSVYWKKLIELLDVKQNLLSHLADKSTLKMFVKEPRIVETLIQEVDQNQMTTPIKEELAHISKVFNRELSRLKNEEMLKIIDLVNYNKCSFKQALASLKSPLNIQCIIEFRLKNAKISVPSDLLCSASDYFNGLLKEKLKDLNTLEISIPDEDSENFKTIIEYLKNGYLDLTPSNCKYLLDICRKYLFMKFFDQIHARLCTDLNDYLQKIGLEKLLKLTCRFELIALKKGIDETLSQNLPSFFSPDFLEKLEIAQRYLLNASCDLMLKTIYKDMEVLSKDERFSKLLLSILQINQIPFDKIFQIFLSLLRKNPKLLRTMWDLASDCNALSVLDGLFLFCKRKENTAIWLHEFDLPPMYDQLKFTRSHLEVLEIADCV